MWCIQQSIYMFVCFTFCDYDIAIVIMIYSGNGNWRKEKKCIAYQYIHCCIAQV